MYRLRSVLTRLGYHVVGTARNGREAVESASRLHPDLILMDVEMPELDGISATREIMRSHPTAILMLSAYSDHQTIRRALAAGASGNLVKPATDAQLAAAVPAALERFQLERELNGPS
ncbi:MAG: response regulator [Armatimonadota bacterium]